MTTAIRLCLLVPLAVAGCGTAPAASDAGGAPCDGSTCEGEAPPESVCLEHIAADQWDDGCGVFVGTSLYSDDAYPGTKDKPVRTIQRAVDLARVGRGRVFACNDVFEGAVTLPSGVDLLGGLQCLSWSNKYERLKAMLVLRDGGDIALTIEPARDGDTGAADGVSRIDHFSIKSRDPIGVLIRSGAVVEFVHDEIRSSNGVKGRRGEDGPDQLAPTGSDGRYGADACSAAVVAGGASVSSPCSDGVAVTGGKGGDGYANVGSAGEDGVPRPADSSDRAGLGGRGDAGDDRCEDGQSGRHGAQGTDGEAGEGIGRISETGWEGGKAGDGGPGAPGGSGGGGGGRRGGLALCGDASKGGASGGAGGSGGCGGQGGNGGWNGPPAIGILALHAKVTLRDTHITTLSAGPGGDGGEPQLGGSGGRPGYGGSLADDRKRACAGGQGGRGGPGGYGGGGRGGDSIGIAYLDEHQLVMEGVTFHLGAPGKGGITGYGDPRPTAPDCVAAEAVRFPE
jgi:hypothetical protein